MRRKLSRALAGSLVVLFVVVGAARAIRMQGGDIVVNADGGVSPTVLPKDHDVPITMHGWGKISTLSGNLPPIMSTVALEFDRRGLVQTTGLPVCTKAKLEATTVPVARHNCPGAIVGKGIGRAVVKFPEQAPIPISSPLTFFNGPKQHGFDTLFAHAYTTVPVPTTLIMPIVIERIHKGLYGYRTAWSIPAIAGGFGIPISASLRIGRRWTYHGKRYSYFNGRCATGLLRARGEFAFKDNTVLTATLFKPCRVRR